MNLIRRRAINSLGGGLGCGLTESNTSWPGRKPGQPFPDLNSHEIRQSPRISGNPWKNKRPTGSPLYDSNRGEQNHDHDQIGGAARKKWTRSWPP